jgi:hypothetical protein
LWDGVDEERRKKAREELEAKVEVRGWGNLYVSEVFMTETEGQLFLLRLPQGKEREKGKEVEGEGGNVER